MLLEVLLSEVLQESQQKILFAATLNLLKKLMVKRAKFTLTMCNLRSKQGTLQKFIRKKFCSFKKYAYLCGDSSHHASQLAQRTRVGLLYFTIPSSTFLQMALSGIVIMQPFHTHKYCRWQGQSCRSNIHKFGWCPTELV